MTIQSARVQRAWIASGMLAGATLFAAGCADKALLPRAGRGASTVVRFSVQSVIGTELSATGKAIDVYVGYDRQGGSRIALAHATIDVEPADAQATTDADVNLTVDLSPCLADASRVGTRDGCTIRITVAIHNATSVLLDSLEVDPVDASPGKTPTVPAIDWHTEVTSTITAGDNFSCALNFAGAAYCWGLNTSGQLGNGTTTLSSTPVAVSGGLTFTAIDAGTSTVCGITSQRAVYCWGSGISGQLGDTTSGVGRQSTTPIAVRGNLQFAAISVGNATVCGLTTAGAAYCWGRNGGVSAGQLGALGNGTDSALAAVPLPVSGGLTFRAIGAAVLHACGLTTTGAAYCWGSGTLIPTAVAGGNTFSALGVGSAMTCGSTPAGTASCWAGIGAIAPAPVTGGVVFDAVFPSAANPAGSTCGIAQIRTAYCWTGISGTPTALATTATFRAISPGGSHICGITTSHSVFCWGTNNFGQLGDGTTTNRTNPAAVAGAFKPR
jgi:hypothetical protein